MAINKKQLQRKRRQKRVRAKIHGTAERPRLSVFRSNKAIYAQLIDDLKCCTLVAASSQEIKALKKNKTEIATEVGKLLGQKAQQQKITQAVFDRGGYRFHGRVKALAEGAQSAGLKI